MGDVIRSLDDQISLWQTYGAFQRCFAMAQTNNSSAAATTTSGYVTMQKYPTEITVPTLGTGVTGALCTRLNMVNEDTSTGLIAALATNLGNINMSTGTFTDGSAMPTRSVKNASVTTSAQLVVAVVTVAVTATTPTVTITYTDQDGNGSQTATLVLPTSPGINSAFLVNPHLATDDTGIRDITNVTKSAGSAGTIVFYGLHVLKYQTQSSAAALANIPVSNYGVVPWIAAGGDAIQFYRVGTNTSSNIIANVTLQPDN